MKQRRANGQLLPLHKRRTEAQMAKRDEKAQYRSNIARQIGIINYGLAQFFGRNLRGRLKWLVMGR